ncbi:MAG: DUF4249 family protein [Bacteroidales bacterium]|nr:DUF4249 family protein [Bacteroidales bacterium]
MKKICLFLLVMLALTSCVKDVILDAKEDPLLAVYCVLKNEPVQELKLSYTKSVTMDEAPRVTEATAVLTDLTEGREAGRFVQVADSLWRLEYSAIPTHSYRLEVTVPGMDPVWAEQMMPAEPPVEVVDVNTLSPQDVPWLGELDPESLFPWADDIYFDPAWPPETRGFFYRLSSPSTIWVYSGLWISGQFALGTSLCTDYPDIDGINQTGTKWEGRKIKEEDWEKDMEGLAFHITYFSDVPLYRDFIRFQKKDVRSQSYFTVDFLTNDNDMGRRLYFAALSDDYDRYLLDAYQQYYAEQSDDLSTIYLRDNLYGNIHGGVGIFGAATEFEMPYRRVEFSGIVWRNGIPGLLG